MKRVKLAGIPMLISVFLIVMPSRGEAQDAIEELKSCARINESTARIACYEELGSRVLNEGPNDNSNENSNEGPDAAPAASEVLADGLGGVAFEKKAETYNDANRGRITSCRQGPDKKWSFFFENGQIWKQSDGRRYRFKECVYYVTITKDTFGYKMQIDGEKGKVRIRRTR